MFPESYQTTTPSGVAYVLSASSATVGSDALLLNCQNNNGGVLRILLFFYLVSIRKTK
jgi:hypothetical protein